MSAPKGSVPWNAGTGKGWVDDKGYRWLYVTEDGRRRARREHRVIMEQKLGRRLEPWEEVHHLNHDKKDNRPENLILIEHDEHQAHHHKGTERSDLTKARMATVARMKWEIEHLRKVNADLLAALKGLVGIETMRSAMDFEDREATAWKVEVARAAIAKASGKEESAPTSRT